MKSLLNFSIFYNLFQNFLGAKRARKIFSKEYINSNKSNRILDLCCGPCDILPHLEFSQYVGVDFNENHINHSKKKYREYKNASFILEDIDLFLNNHTMKFDIILFLGGMHHIDDEKLTNILQKIQACLAPNGRLITLDGCFEPQLSWFTKMMLANDQGQFVRTKEDWIDIFTAVFTDYKYSIRKDLLHVPYNHIIFYK